MLALFLSTFITLFVVIDPPGCAPIFASLTNGASPVFRRAMAIRATVVAGIILLVFALVGEEFLKMLGVSLDAFRIAGGVMLFLIALEMVFERRSARRQDRAAEVNQDPEREDVSIFPMAIPMLAGPGSIATVMLLTSETGSYTGQLVMLAAFLSVMLLTLVAMLTAGPMMRLLGQKFEIAITRILGVILAALATQFIIDGLRASFLV